jgi:hypothetical protein
MHMSMLQEGTRTECEESIRVKVYAVKNLNTRDYLAGSLTRGSAICSLHLGRNLLLRTTSLFGLVNYFGYCPFLPPLQSA